MSETAVKERPILFSVEMVRAILDGRKTQTRRVVTPRNAEFGSADNRFWEHADFGAETCFADTGRRSSPDPRCDYLHVPAHQGPCEFCHEWGWEETRHRLYSRVGPGDRLWVRETWCNPPDTNGNWCIAYKADGTAREQLCDGDGEGDPVRVGAPVTPYLPEGIRWKPSIHMPRWASRITLEITAVRVERLQEISEEDAAAEGLRRNLSDTYWLSVAKNDAGNHKVRNTARECFCDLWESINGAGSWDANPWVWVYEFKRLPTEPTP